MSELPVNENAQVAPQVPEHNSAAAAGVVLKSAEVPGPSPTEEGGPPKTPYALVLLLAAIVPAYSELFKVWDESEFPETFTNPVYWTLLSVIFLLAGTVAYLMRSSSLSKVREFFARTRRTWLDGAIVVAFFVLGVLAVILAISANWKKTPSREKFTVVLFTFDGDNATTQNAAATFQRFVKRRLEREFGNEVICVLRERKIKGENFSEELASARKWTLRKTGCHLAVWGKIEMNEDGQHYDGSLHFLKAAQFGKEVEDDAIAVFDSSDQFEYSFNKKMPVGFAQSVDEEEIEATVDVIKLCWGLAFYRKGDYDAALRILPSRFANAEYFAGQAALTKARASLESNQLYEDAETHFYKAIRSNGYEKRKESDLRPDKGLDLNAALYYLALGAAYESQTLSRHAPDLKQAGKEAVSAFSEAENIYGRYAYKQGQATALVHEASSLEELSSIDAGSTDSSTDLSKATDLLSKALAALQQNSVGYARAQEELGFVYILQQKYQEAIPPEEFALNFYNQHKLPSATVGPLNDLGVAHTARGRILNRAGQTNDAEQEFKEGMANFAQAFESCGWSVYNCSLAHEDAGDGLVRWALSFRRNSPPWAESLEQALKQYDDSLKYLSPTQQPEGYVELKLRKANIYTEQAVGEDQKQGQPLIPLKAQRDDLKDGIDTLRKVDHGAERLRRSLLQCCRSIAAYSSNPDDARKCRDLLKTKGN